MEMNFLYQTTTEGQDSSNTDFWEQYNATQEKIANDAQYVTGQKEVIQSHEDAVYEQIHTNATMIPIILLVCGIVIAVGLILKALFASHSARREYDLKLQQMKLDQELASLDRANRLDIARLQEQNRKDMHTSDSRQRAALSLFAKAGITLTDEQRSAIEKEIDASLDCLRPASSNTDPVLDSFDAVSPLSQAQEDMIRLTKDDE